MYLHFLDFENINLLQLNFYFIIIENYPHLIIRLLESNFVTKFLFVVQLGTLSFIIDNITGYIKLVVVRQRGNKYERIS